MRKICHIRCNNNYWQKLDLSNLSPRWEKNKNQFSYYTQILNLWDKNLKIKHLPFRKQIRDLILDRISNIGYFDIILESNQHCEEYFNKHTSSDILFYQQDDDDIFLCLPKLDELSDGINIFNYSFIDPVGGRRKKGYKTRVFGFDKPTRTIQSNHSLIYNKNNYIDIINYTKQVILIMISWHKCIKVLFLIILYQYNFITYIVFLYGNIILGNVNEIILKKAYLLIMFLII